RGAMGFMTGLMKAKNIIAKNEIYAPVTTCKVGRMDETCRQARVKAGLRSTLNTHLNCFNI
ncbi:hypothetical protein QMO17_32605, partial [Klebsiella pneumoniae]|nr:hypothetical protein [Klebsiella pneumoniae]